MNSHTAKSTSTTGEPYTRDWERLKDRIQAGFRGKLGRRLLLWFLGLAIIPLLVHSVVPCVCSLLKSIGVVQGTPSFRGVPGT